MQNFGYQNQTYWNALCISFYGHLIIFFSYKDQKKDVEEYKIYLEKSKTHNEKKAKELNNLRETLEKKTSQLEKLKLESLETAKLCIAKVRRKELFSFIEF